MELKDLTGKHILSGIDTGTNNEDSNTILFILDGVTYKATEDPEDGYRSTMNELEVSNDKVQFTFEGQEVVGILNESNSNDIIEFHDAKTGQVILEIGTTDIDDYYPCCVMNYFPQNMSINK